MDYLNNKIHWRDVVGFPDYSVSDKGYIRSNRNGILLKPNIHPKTGYSSVCLRPNKGEARKRVNVHRIVATAFYGESSLVVNHIDGVRDNNNLSNLEFCTPSQNQQHRFLVLKHGNEKLFKRVIRIEDGTIYESLTAASEANNIHLGNISQVCKGNRSVAGGFHWKYI